VRLSGATVPRAGSQAQGSAPAAQQLMSRPSAGVITRQQRARPREPNENDKTLAEAVADRELVPPGKRGGYDGVIAACLATRAAVAVESDARPHYDAYHQVLLRMRRRHFVPTCRACKALEDATFEMCDDCYQAMCSLHSRQ